MDGWWVFETRYGICCCCYGITFYFCVNAKWTVCFDYISTYVERALDVPRTRLHPLPCTDQNKNPIFRELILDVDVNVTSFYLIPKLQLIINWLALICLLDWSKIVAQKITPKKLIIVFGSLVISIRVLFHFNLVIGRVGCCHWRPGAVSTQTEYGIR